MTIIDACFTDFQQLFDKESPVTDRMEKEKSTDNARTWRLPVVLLVLSAALSMPAVLSGWMNDDYFFDTALYETDAPFGYYDFIARFKESHLLPWWVDSDFKLRFFRPLSSLTLHLDFTSWGSSAFGAHVHSLIWSLLQIFGGFLLLGRVLPRREARLAMIIFTLAICHAWGAGWVAARNGVVGGAFAVWSAYFYIRWRQSKEGRFAVGAFGLYRIVPAILQPVAVDIGIAIRRAQGAEVVPASDDVVVIMVRVRPDIVVADYVIA